MNIDCKNFSLYFHYRYKWMCIHVDITNWILGERNMSIKWLHSVPFNILKVVHFRCIFVFFVKIFDDWKLTCFLFLGMEQKDSSDVPKAKRGRKKKVGSCIIRSVLLAWFWMEKNGWRWVTDLFILNLTLHFPFCFCLRLIMNKRLKRMMLQEAPLVTQVILLSGSHLFSSWMDGGTQGTHIRPDIHGIYRRKTILMIQDRSALLCGLFPDQVGKVQKEEAGSPEVRSYFCFRNKAQEATCKCTHTSDIGGCMAPFQSWRGVDSVTHTTLAVSQDAAGPHPSCLHLQGLCRVWQEEKEGTRGQI